MKGQQKAQLAAETKAKLAATTPSKAKADTNLALAARRAKTIITL